MSFETLGLAPDLVRAVGDCGYTIPTPIQEKAIPLILDGKDLLAAAQTGTGKTAAFVLPLLQRLNYVGQARRREVRSLVLTPTRELAVQVYESARDYGRHLALRSAAVYGGVKAGPQIASLSRGTDLLVATPGRLLDLHAQDALDFSSLEVLVLDEADRMLDMGFIRDIRRILALLPQDRQTLMFSATFSREIRALAAEHLCEPAHVEVAPPNSTTELVDQAVYPVERQRKAELLLHLLREEQWHRALVFTRTKHGANRLCQRLLKKGIEAAPIHGNKSQNARQRALAAFKRGELQVLVATDIAARGLDIDELPDVVNFDLPSVPEDYVHRIGRTGRAGACGRSHSLVSSDDMPLLESIERLTRQKLRRVHVPGFTETPSPGDTTLHGRGKPSRARQAGSTQGASARQDTHSGEADRPRRRRRRRSASGRQRQSAPRFAQSSG